MSASEPRDDPAEERLLALLAVLHQTAPTAASVGLTSAVMRRVRWQRTVRRFLTFAGNLTSSVFDGFVVAARRENRDRR